MNIGGILGIVYGIGLFGGLVYVGAKDLKWGDGYGFFGPAWMILFWPLGLPVVAGHMLREAVEARAVKRRLEENERQKWLNAKVE